MVDAAPVVPTIRVGVLAVQGSFREHISSLNRLPCVEAIEVRRKDALWACQASLYCHLGGKEELF